jgi:hypothetical protein
MAGVMVDGVLVIKPGSIVHCFGTPRCVRVLWWEASPCEWLGSNEFIPGRVWRGLTLVCCSAMPWKSGLESELHKVMIHLFRQDFSGVLARLCSAG